MITNLEKEVFFLKKMLSKKIQIYREREREKSCNFLVAKRNTSVGDGVGIPTITFEVVVVGCVFLLLNLLLLLLHHDSLVGVGRSIVDNNLHIAVVAVVVDVCGGGSSRRSRARTNSNGNSLLLLSLRHHHGDGRSSDDMMIVVVHVVVVLWLLLLTLLCLLVRTSCSSSITLLLLLLLLGQRTLKTQGNFSSDGRAVEELNDVFTQEGNIIVKSFLDLFVGEGVREGDETNLTSLGVDGGVSTLVETSNDVHDLIEA